MFCPKCGAQNADNYVVCTSCGAELLGNAPVQQVAYQEAVQPAAPVVPVAPVAPEVPYQAAPVQPQYQAQPNYGAPGFQQPMYPQPAPTVPGKGLGIASMVLGIISLVLFCIWYISIPCGLVGLILGAVSMGQAKNAGMKNGMAVAGLVCSIISMAIAIFYVVVIVGILSMGF